MKLTKQTGTILAVVLIVIAAAGGFFAGMQYQRSKTQAAFGQFGTGGFRRFGNGQNGMTPVRGTVLSNDGSTLTVKLNDGSSKVVVVSASTSVVKSATSSASDVKTGDMVTVLGTTNSDGSVTAQTVMDGVFGMRGFGPRPSGSPAPAGGNSGY